MTMNLHRYLTDTKSTGDTPEVLWDSQRTADWLGLKAPTLSSWRVRGFGPPFLKIGRLVKYVQTDVEEWAAKQSFSSTGEYPR